jgi:hypothetical protein
MTQHKWHKEIKAWADGAEIECGFHGCWTLVTNPLWEASSYIWRIKPQPKEKKFLYVYNKGSLNKFDFYCSLNELTGKDARTHQYIGKIEVQDD